MNCPICLNNTRQVFSAIVINQYNALYDYCSSCGFLKVRNPFWLSEAYSSAIASTDTGLVMRNEFFSRKLSSVLFGVFGERGRGQYMDVAGGYGMLTRMMRDRGFDFYWSDKYCQNLMAFGFEYVDPGAGGCVAVTAIEVMEHLEDPLAFVREVLQRTRAQAFIFSTELFDAEPPAPDQWRYYSFETGQHIAFFQRKTLQVMASKLGMNFASAGGLHIFSTAEISPLRLTLCTGKASAFIAALARKLLGTKVMADHALMVQRLKQK